MTEQCPLGVKNMDCSICEATMYPCNPVHYKNRKQIVYKLEKLIGDLEYLHDFFDKIKREDIIDVQAHVNEILALHKKSVGC